MWPLTGHHDVQFENTKFLLCFEYDRAALQVWERTAFDVVEHNFIQHFMVIVQTNKPQTLCTSLQIDHTRTHYMKIACENTREWLRAEKTNGYCSRRKRVERVENEKFLHGRELPYGFRQGWPIICPPDETLCIFSAGAASMKEMGRRGSNVKTYDSLLYGYPTGNLPSCFLALHACSVYAPVEPMTGLLWWKPLNPRLRSVIRASTARCYNPVVLAWKTSF